MADFVRKISWQMSSKYGEYGSFSIFDTSLRDFDLYSRSQGLEKAKSSVPIISQCSQAVWMEFDVALLPTGRMN